MKQHVLAIAFGIATLSACASAPPTPAAGSSAECAILQHAATAALDGPEIGEPDRTTLRAITTQPLPSPLYRCGDATYQTDRRRLGDTYTGIGFSQDRRYARLEFQHVAGPLAGTGYACLYQARNRSWTLRGCEVDWIS